jgi:transcription-repair coupling factor (superfamily II helicase)
MFSGPVSLDPPHHTILSGAPAGHDARLLAELAQRAQGRPLIHVAVDDMRAALLVEALSFFAPHVECLSFPAWDCLPYDRISPHPDILSQRIATLTRLRGPYKRPCLIVTTIAAATQKTLPPEALDEVSLRLAIGEECSLEKLRRFLTSSGYVTAGTVREPGEYAVRGGIVDLFPPGIDEPVRIDYFGDEVESLRSFDPLNQTTTGKLESLALTPISEVLLNERSIASFRGAYRELFGVATENDPLYTAVTAGQKFPGVEHWLGLFYPRLATLFDYAPTAPISIDAQIDDALNARWQQVEDFYAARLSLFEAARRDKKKEQASAIYKPAPLGGLYLSPDDLQKILKEKAVITLSPFKKTPESTAIDGGGSRGHDFADARAQEGQLYEAVKKYAERYQGEGKRVVIACYSQGAAERLAGLLRGHGFNTITSAKSWEEIRKCDPKLIALFVFGLDHGFTAPDIALITEQDILGERLIRNPRKKRAAAQFQLELGSLERGDFVVHAEHGVGRYEGLETIHALGLAHDCVRLIYDGGDKLFVPVENLDVLTRYGSAESGAVLDKLGGVAWQARKARVKKRLLDMADGLLKIAAERQLKTGEMVQAPEGAYQEFAARFPYPETEDQAKTIEDVLDDLQSGKPMDRLVCGDVGFGKTEVALRAAFAAVQSGLQVAIVVPTTLLARQHYNQFVQRFSPFPVRIAQMSRLVPSSEMKKTKELLKTGGVDIVVGTHALLAKDVNFARLGLLVIDEEQHFGVKQKERFKELRADVHVLTLTATPIPRTLQLALTGVRELSLITTPPVDRLAVRTYVLPYDPLVIREAIMREHYRGGQSFYVCPRIEDLASVAAELRELVPEAKVVTAHGRMSPTELEDIMTSFDARRYDILLATNIIESGLDIPNANTIILHRADLFGLSQLYQLRGRVGRAKQRGYAYFTYAPTAGLSSTAQQRLEVIQTLDQLGAGFQLASHDMDIRGAGNLLGEEQSGHIREVGIELYQQMLEDAVASAKQGDRNEVREDRWTPQINIGMSVLIPEDYVADLNVRLGLYRRLAEGTADGMEGEDSESIAAEMIDRFGPLPPEVENLLQTVAIKNLCRKAHIAKIDAGPKGAVISFKNDIFPRPDKLVRWIGEQAGTAKVRPDQKLVLIRTWDDSQTRLNGLKKVLGSLVELAS